MPYTQGSLPTLAVTERPTRDVPVAGSADAGQRRALARKVVSALADSGSCRITRGDAVFELAAKDQKQWDTPLELVVNGVPVCDVPDVEAALDMVDDAFSNVSTGWDNAVIAPRPSPSASFSDRHRFRWEDDEDDGD